jgi:hypothetical protein
VPSAPAVEPRPDDLGGYCRRVEDHLTRANGGHLVRIVGAGFALVRQWAVDGVPLSVVCRGIDLKAERHRLGRARRPLRIEFCRDDVQAVFEHWQRAVGVSAVRSADRAGSSAAGPDQPPAAPVSERRASLGKQLDRIIERLSRVAGRMDLPAGVIDAVARALADLAVVREEARRAKGENRTALVARAAAVDGTLIEAVRHAVGDEWVALRLEAQVELSAYRHRLAPDLWALSVDAGAMHLLRARYGLPTVEVE